MTYRGRDYFVLVFQRKRDRNDGGGMTTGKQNRKQRNPISNHKQKAKKCYKPSKYVPSDALPPVTLQL